jgi:hypothetical protein
MDDMISLTPRVRFIVEIILVLFLIFTTGYQINDFHGLWNMQEIPLYFSVPLTVVASVGIIMPLILSTVSMAIHRAIALCLACCSVSCSIRWAISVW